MPPLSQQNAFEACRGVGIQDINLEGHHGHPCAMVWIQDHGQGASKAPRPTSGSWELANISEPAAVVSDGPELMGVNWSRMDHGIKTPLAAGKQEPLR